MSDTAEISASDMAQSVAGSHPKIDASMVENNMRQKVAEMETPKAPELKADASIPRDKSGEIFDPKKHKADDYGRPQLTNKGYFKKYGVKDQIKRRLRGVENQSGKPSENSPTQEAKTPEPHQQADSGASARRPLPDQIPLSGAPGVSEPAKVGPSPEDRAKVMCATIFGVGLTLGGSDCAPLQEHRTSMESGWAEFYRHYPDWTPPPWAAPVFPTVGYLAFCYQQKTFREKSAPMLARIGDLFKGAAGKVGAMIGKARARKAVSK